MISSVMYRTKLIMSIYCQLQMRVSARTLHALLPSARSHLLAHVAASSASHPQGHQIKEVMNPKQAHGSGTRGVDLKTKLSKLDVHTPDFTAHLELLMGKPHRKRIEKRRERRNNYLQDQRAHAAAASPCPSAPYRCRGLCDLVCKNS